MEQSKVKPMGELKKEDVGSLVFLGRRIAQPSSRLFSNKALGQIIQNTAERLGLILTEE